MVCPKLFLFFFGLIYRVPLIKTPSIVDKTPNTQSTRKYVSDVFIQEETGYRSKKQLLLEPSNYFDKSALIYSFLSDPYVKLSRQLWFAFIFASQSGWITVKPFRYLHWHPSRVVLLLWLESCWKHPFHLCLY
jgi:hypothetical protein